MDRSEWGDVEAVKKAHKNGPPHPFGVGNQIWRKIPQLSGPEHHSTKYKDPLDLVMDAQDYFEWAEENALRVQIKKHIAGTNEFAETHERKARMFTMTGLCLYIGVQQRTFVNWSKEGHHLHPVTEWIRAVIHEQKLTGAAAGVFNANLVVRDLGLADRRVTEGTTRSEVTMINDDVKTKEAGKLYEATLHPDPD